MAQPPAGSSLLFGAIAGSGRIKELKNDKYPGSYRMVLKGVDEIDWLTDRPDTVDSTWRPQKLVRKWDKWFAAGTPIAQATVNIDGQRELFTFQMFKPKKIRSGKMKFNIKPMSDLNKEKVVGIESKSLDDISLFIGNSVSSSDCDDDHTPYCVPWCQGKDFSGDDLSGGDLSGADLEDINLESADLTGANLSDANLYSARLYKTILVKANLYEASLERADCGYADFTMADLSGARLDGAEFVDANFSGADFINTDFAGAMIMGANFTDANLTGATNLYPSEDTIWDNTTCPDGTLNSGTSPCTFEQLNLA